MGIESLSNVATANAIPAHGSLRDHQHLASFAICVMVATYYRVRVTRSSCIHFISV
jgi:hypothetical protein